MRSVGRSLEPEGRELGDSEHFTTAEAAATCLQQYSPLNEKLSFTFDTIAHMCKQRYTKQKGAICSKMTTNTAN